MQNRDTIYSLVVASMLAGFLIMPSMAEDGVGVQPLAPPHEPVYVWQGNRADQPRVHTMQQSPQDISGMPQAMRQGDVSYITGGIGDEERYALQAVKDEYNLHITNTNNSGEFEGDTQITVRDRQGNPVLTATAGPIFLANLPAGKYTVEAVSGGQTRTQRVALGGGKPASVYLRW